MDLGVRIDSFVRRSVVAGFSPWIKRRAPRAYQLALRAYHRVVPIESEFGLSRYQSRSIARFLEVLDRPLSDCVLLEIGSDLQGSVLREFLGRGAKAVHGINPAIEDLDGRFADLPEGCTLTSGDARALDLPDCSVDAVFSISVFEHLPELPVCLAEMARVLKPGGVVFADFGPIWTSSVGHHVYAIVGDEEARHWIPEKNPIPNYLHLLLDRGEMAAELRGAISEPLLDAVLAWVYDGDGINRLAYEDYTRAFADCGLDLERFIEDKEIVPAIMRRKLIAQFGTSRVVDVRNIEAVLRKPRAAQPSAAPRRGAGPGDAAPC